MSPQNLENNINSNNANRPISKNYSLIISEKPSAAKRIAYALDLNGKPKKFMMNNITCFIAYRDKKLVIVPSIGHLYSVTQKKGRTKYYPVFDFDWSPRYRTKKGSQKIRDWIKTFSDLSLFASEYISACDYDIEGSLIGYFVLKYACKNKEFLAKRMKFSTLLKNELITAYENPLAQLNFAVIEAGKTRHELDWLYGINLSRALTSAANNWSSKYLSLTTGRVQGPTLNFLMKREKTIRNFVPVPYWEISFEVEILNSVIKADYERKRIDTYPDVDRIIRDCSNQIGKVEKIDLTFINKKPLVPFDLSNLQHEAYRLFGYSPQYTLSIAQRLYLNALISYPRTSSQKLPSLIDFKKILYSLKEFNGYKRLASKLLKKKFLKPFEGNKTDSAHPSIYPTGELPNKQLNSAEKRIFDLIVRRFLSVFGEDAVFENLKVQLKVKNHIFILKGKQFHKHGWIQYYKPFVKIKEVLLPSINIGDEVKLQKVVPNQKFVSPPPRYNQSTLLRKMEKMGIGTKTTRANIINTLYKRNYVKGEKIIVTELGLAINKILSEYVPEVVSVELTREIENKMEQIKNGDLNREKVLHDVINQLRPLLEFFKNNEDKIGKFLSGTSGFGKLENSIIGNCPDCKTGKLVIIHSKKTKKRFIGCTNYFVNECETSFPLPQSGSVKPTQKKCKYCSWTQVIVEFKGKKPWYLCFNPDCS